MRFLTIILFFWLLGVCSCKSTETITHLNGKILSGSNVKIQWDALTPGARVMDINNLNSEIRFNKIGIYKFGIRGYADSLIAKDTVTVTVTK